VNDKKEVLSDEEEALIAAISGGKSQAELSEAGVDVEIQQGEGAVAAATGLAEGGALAAAAGGPLPGLPLLVGEPGPEYVVGQVLPGELDLPERSEDPIGDGLSPEEALAQDMKLLVALDAQVNNLKARVAEVGEAILAASPTLVAAAAAHKKALKKVQKDFAVLDADIRSDAMTNYEKTKEVDPTLGVKITMNKSVVLDVDEAEAIAWAITNKHGKLLKLDKTKYAAQLLLGTMDGMPGSVDDSKVPKAQVSLKAYLKGASDD